MNTPMECSHCKLKNNDHVHSSIKIKKPQTPNPNAKKKKPKTKTPKKPREKKTLSKQDTRPVGAQDSHWPKPLTNASRAARRAIAY
jgi:hypothetical protein